MNSSTISHNQCAGRDKGTGPSESAEFQKDDEIVFQARTKKVVEQLAAILIGMEPVVDVRLKPRVNMSVIEFTIQDEEDLIVVDQWCNCLCFWPLRFCVVFLREACPA
jgi:hypothetical protein